MGIVQKVDARGFKASGGFVSEFTRPTTAEEDAQHEKDKVDALVNLSTDEEKQKRKAALERVIDAEVLRGRPV